MMKRKIPISRTYEETLIALMRNLEKMPCDSKPEIEKMKIEKLFEDKEIRDIRRVLSKTIFRRFFRQLRKSFFTIVNWKNNFNAQVIQING